ncbi:MAG: hypothetical protein ACT4QC_00560 [Planctomycetaceae bacterium]
MHARLTRGLLVASALFSLILTAAVEARAQTVSSGRRDFQVINTPTGPWFFQRGSGIPDQMVLQDINLEEQVEQAIEQYAAAETDEARATARVSVKDLLEQQFSLRQEQRMRQIAEMEGRVRKMRDTLRRRAGEKEQLIDREWNELLSNAEGLGWGDLLGGALRQAAFQQQQQPGQPVQPGQQQFRDPLPTLKKHVHEAMQTYAAAEADDARAKAKGAVLELLDQQFTVRQERRMHEIVELDRQLKQLRDTLQKRANAKGQIIERRLTRLLNEADNLGWEDAATDGTAGNLPVRQPVAPVAAPAQRVR